MLKKGRERIRVIEVTEKVVAPSDQLSNGHREKSGGCLITPLKWLLALFCVMYLTNPTAGFLEVLPDNMPVVGNLDEAAIAGLLTTIIIEFRKNWLRQRAT